MMFSVLFDFFVQMTRKETLLKAQILSWLLNNKVITS